MDLTSGPIVIKIISTLVCAKCSSVFFVFRIVMPAMLEAQGHR